MGDPLAPIPDPLERAAAAGSGGVPDGGIAALVPEFAVSDIAASLAFWCGPLGFAIAYDRPAARFAFLVRGGLQVMLCERNGRWEPGDLERPFGRGINLQMIVPALAPILTGLEAAGWRLYEAPRDMWYRAGEDEVGQREVLVLDPDGYLLRFCERLAVRPRSA